MQNRIQLLNVAVDISSTETASDATIGYLKEESSKVVYFLNSETLLLLEINSDWKNIVEESELILPGTESVNTSINEVLGRKRDSFLMEHYFDEILDYTTEMGHEIFIVAESQEWFTFIQDNIHEKRPFLTVSGIFLTEQEKSLGHVVNEINSVAPDILLVAFEEKKQLQLLQEYRNQMNAGLLLFTGNILYNKAVSEVEVPKPIQKLRIENLYKWFYNGERIKSFFNNIKIKFKLKRHQKEQES